MRRRLLIIFTALSCVLLLAALLWDPWSPAYRVVNWLFLIVCAAMVAVGIAYRPQWEREQRANRGLCPNCGYDLTANASGTCPECGTPTAKGAKA